MSNWWDDSSYDSKQPMVFPRKDDGPSVPVRVDGGCNQPENCKCKGVRVFRARRDNMKLSCRCTEDKHG